MTEVPKPLDTALDLLVYIPVGLALTAAEELPRLADKGRSRVQNQLMMARVVGQFAVNRGRQELERRFTPGPAAPGPAPVDAPVAAEAEPPVDFDQMTANGSTNGHVAVLPGADYADVTDEVAVSAVGDLPPAGDLAPAPPAGPAPAAGELAIPGYDSLSASQVLQRLPGLSGAELAAVAAYEHAHRGRRTILNRIDQLQGQ